MILKSIRKMTHNIEDTAHAISVFNDKVDAAAESAKELTKLLKGSK